MFKSVLITGGAGFIGSSLAIQFKRSFSSVDVAAFDNLRRRGSELNLPRLAREGVRFVHGDVRSAADLSAVQPAPELILECSAEASAQAGYHGSPDYLVDSNLNGCFHCLELARRTGAALLFLSTSRVYPFAALNSLAYRETETRFELAGAQQIPGASADGIAEGFPLEGPRSLYGMTKLAAELMIAEYAAAYGVPAIVNRCGLTAGPWQMGRSDQGVVALWVAAHEFGHPLRYIGFGGGGKQVRDVLHIDDLCELVADQAANFAAYAGGAWNVGGGISISLSLRELTTLCRAATGRTVEIGSEPCERPADIRIYLSDSRRVSAVRGWRPRRTAEQAIADVAAWTRLHASELQPVLAAALS
jgi:CDP-paratose 2-epimerase